MLCFPYYQELSPFKEEQFKASLWLIQIASITILVLWGHYYVKERLNAIIGIPRQQLI
jgi:hypothetical protein